MQARYPVLAAFIVRWILAVLFTMAGYWKVFQLTPTEHARQFFVEAYVQSWIPQWLLWSLGTTIPLLELAAGLLLFLGLRLKETLIGLGGLLIVTTYGHALQQPLFDIDGHTFTRLALIVFLLMVGWEDDRTTLDYHLRAKSR